MWINPARVTQHSYDHEFEILDVARNSSPESTEGIMSDKPKITVSEDGVLGFDWPERTPEEKAARKSFSARYGHVKRRLTRYQPLTDDLLEFALECFADETIREKLKKGEPLTEYELHVLLDV